jgi:chitinase
MAAPATGGSAPTTTTTGTTSPPTTLSTVTTSASPTSTGSGTVPQWGQCGGQGYTGPTQCASPYSCVATSTWWSQCE